MIRFILKSALFLGIASMLIPGERREGEAAGGDFSAFTAIMGAQAAIADMSGLCERAPMACQAGSQALGFAAERIGAGLALAYSMVGGGPATPEAEPAQRTHVTGRDRLYVRVDKQAEPERRPLEAEAAAAFARGASEALATGSIRPAQPMPAATRERPAEPTPKVARKPAPPRSEAPARPALIGIPGDRPAADLGRGAVVAVATAAGPVPRGSIPERASAPRLPVPSPRP